MKPGASPRRIFVDTNVLLDVLLEREGFYNDSILVWAASEEHHIMGCVSPTAVSDIHYIVRKFKSETTAMVAVRMILRVFSVLSINHSILQLAADLHEKDFEDDIQLHCAIQGRCTQLVTRNPNHFRSDAISIITPAVFATDFRKQYAPLGYRRHA